ncbi:hypothetical protein OHB36_23360 [Streptomyces sp. NBC_00320]|uniref:hypothetical protein n=1 Tax=Streptomyces sp. NBC_00320 TaxID=2975711 RepID=UPI002253C3A4|nr:hypothetical protein [Streptomyces sp. NBC_00320]MCX5149681.1 hypothetical protein [Streptomyces sp. NBC_00320]
MYLPSRPATARTLATQLAAPNAPYDGGPPERKRLGEGLDASAEPLTGSGQESRDVRRP